MGPSCHLFGVTQTEDKPSPETGVLEPKKILGNSENNTLVLPGPPAQKVRKSSDTSHTSLPANFARLSVRSSKYGQGYGERAAENRRNTSLDENN